MTALGIDAGATHVRYGTVEDGKLNHSNKFKGRVQSPDDLVNQIKEIVVQFPHLDTIGIVTPGPLDKNGILHSPPNLPDWGTVNFRALLAKAIKRPFTYDRDSVAALYGEWQMGAAKGLKNFVLLTLGTGIGGAALVDGRILRGAHGFSGELGHALVGQTGRRCGLGHDGCAEAWSSGRAIENGVSIDQAVDVLARLIITLNIIFDPEIFVLTGGLTAHQTYIDTLKKRLDSLGLQTPVNIGKFGEWAGVVGAALLARDYRD